MKTIAGRSVRMFRCHIPPLISGKSLQAHMTKDLRWTAEVTQDCSGLTVVNERGIEYFVPFTNIQNIELDPESAATITPLKPKASGPKGVA